MSNLDELLILLGLAALAGFWIKQSGARERATRIARAQCEHYGLQLLDETVGLRAWRMRRHAGRLGLERGYGFEVSIDGADREAGMLWLREGVLIELRLPTVVLAASGRSCEAHRDTATPALTPSTSAEPPAALPPPVIRDNVVTLTPRRDAGNPRSN